MRKLIACLLLAWTVSASAAEDVTAKSAAEALRRATAFLRSIATNGGYCGIYSADLKQRYGESLKHKAKPADIWVQPPGTPTVGATFLRAYRATHDRTYLNAARDVGLALAWGQNANGGWTYLADVSLFKGDSKVTFRRNRTTTFDDNTTQAAVTFLMDLDQILDEPWLDEAVKLGLGVFLDSQFPNGAWPQRFPLSTQGYAAHYTFNDKAMNDCIRVMFRAHELYRTQAYLDSARKGGDFIVLSQLPAPQAGWAQQYSHDLKPAWARAFEPPAVCSAVTVHNIRTLVEVYLRTRDEKVLKPIPAAVDWLKRSPLKPGLWARMYELKTNRPIYGDRDGKVHYTLAEISEERRSGYSWQGSYGVSDVIRWVEKVRADGVDAILAARNRKPTPAERAKRARSLRPKVEKIIGALDAKGRWLEDGRITTKAFVRNAGVLCEYLEMMQSE